VPPLPVFGGGALTTTNVRLCAGCREVADLADLLEIVDTRSGRTFHVHRPTGTRPCFRHKVLGADVHRVIPTPEPQA